MKQGHFFLILTVLAAFLTAGCDRRSVADAEAAERSDSLFKKASDAETIADYDTAINLYQELVCDKPRMASAQLQLAILLHDRKQDYIGAVYHYNRYLVLQPESEKQSMVQERIKKAEQSLTSSLFKRIGTSMQGFTEAELMKSKQDLEKELTRVLAENVHANERIQALEQRNTDLENKITQLQKLREDLGLRDQPATSGGSTAAEIAEARRLAAGNTSRATETSIESVRADLNRMMTPTDGKPREYVIKSGDTLFNLSKKFGVSEKALHDANRSRIGADASKLKIGQTILIP